MTGTFSVSLSIEDLQHVYLNLHGIEVPVEKGDENNYGSSVNRCLFAYGEAVKYITLHQPARVGYRGTC